MKNLSASKWISVSGYFCFVAASLIVFAPMSNAEKRTPETIPSVCIEKSSSIVSKTMQCEPVTGNMDLTRCSFLSSNQLFEILALIIIVILWSAHLRYRVSSATKELRKQNEDLRKSRDLLSQSDALDQALFNQTVQFIALLDKEGRILKANRAALKFFDLDFQQVEKMCFYEAPWWPDKKEAKQFCEEAFQIALSGHIFKREVIQIDPAGQEYSIDLSISPFFGEDGEILYFIAEGRDITEIREAQDSALENEKIFRAIFDNAPYSITIVNYEDKSYLDANKAFLNHFGLEKKDLQNLNADQLYPGAAEDNKRIREMLQKEGIARNIEARVQRNDGTWSDVIFSCILLDLLGKKRVLTIAVNISAKMEVERALKENESVLRSLFAATPAGVALLKDRVFFRVNAAMCNLSGYTEEELVGQNVRLTYHSDEEYERVGKQLYSQMKRDGLGVTESYIRRKDGQIIDVLITLSPLDPHDLNAGVCATLLDISNLKGMQEALLLTESKLHSLFAAMNDQIFVFDKEGRYLEIAPTDESLLYRPARDMLGKTVLEIFPQEKALLFLEVIEHALNSRNRISIDYDLEIGSRNLWFSANVSPLEEDKVLFVARDITDRKRVEAERIRLTAAIEQSGEIIVITDPDGTIQYVNAAFVKITGYSRLEVIGKNPRVLKSGVHDQEFYSNLWRTIKKGKTWNGRFVNQRKDGSRYTEETTISPVCDSEGNIVNFVAAKRDISAELELEEHSRQMQKMEAIGQLTGGVAHDFNNLLQVINGYTDMAVMDLEEKSKIRDLLDEVRKAGQRAANLVQQLLLFSRRQVMEPKYLDLNSVVEDLLKMLRRVIGEHIRLDWKPQKQIGVIHADSGMLDQVLMNLCVNARDAMPNGGVLTIETKSVQIDADFCATHAWARPGRFVLLEVSDTGCGMSKEVIARIFEPFFTTKMEGKGTGLGLSTVYGIVSQHEGMLTVESEEGRGSSFLVYLPICESEKENEETNTVETIKGGTETLLLAEDDNMVRKLAKDILERAGYRVIVATDGEEAINLFQENADSISLLIFDVVMPRLSGSAAYKQIHQIRPDIQVLFSSGYSDQVVNDDFNIVKSMSLIRKPYSPTDLLKAVREKLDSLNEKVD